MRNSQRNRKQDSHKEFLAKVIEHSKNFAEFHKKKVKKMRKLCYESRNKLNWIEKKEQRMKDKEEKERLKALKENKFEEYLELIKKEKNTRLLHILEETNKYLSDLGAKVVSQKIQNASLSKQAKNVEEDKYMDDQGDLSQDENDISKDQIKDKLIKGNQMYYSITHTINEDIITQPKMLKGGTLKTYQMAGLRWLVSLYNNNLNGILADEMGLGKTIQTISLFSYIMEVKHNDGPFLVVVPLTTISNWDMEFEQWAPDMKKMIYKGSPSVRNELGQRLRNETFNAVLTTYDYIMRDKSVLNKIDWQYIVVDEGHRMK